MIFEDQDGMLWVGTRGGLNRYDPKTERFTRYRHDPEDPHSLGSDVVFAIFEDQDGNLWVGTAGGLDRFESANDGFVHYQHDPNDPTSLSRNAIRAIIEDAEGIMWIGTDGGGLNRFDRQKESFTAYRHNPDDPNTLGHDAINDDGTRTMMVFLVGYIGRRIGPARIRRRRRSKLHASPITETIQMILPA